MASTMIHVNIDRSEPIFWHDQVAAEIRRAIAEGEAGPGDRRPLVKDIAAVLGVNKNTVLRAIHPARGADSLGDDLPEHRNRWTLFN